MAKTDSIAISKIIGMASSRIARRSGLDAEPIPADFRGATGWDGLNSVIPDAAGFRNIQRACWEYLGAAVGR